MNKKDLKVGEVYAYSSKRRDNPCGRLTPVRLIGIDEEIVVRRWLDGSVNKAKGIAVEQVDPETFEPLETRRPFLIDGPARLWRTWAEQVSHGAAEKEARLKKMEEQAARRAADEAVNAGLWADIEYMIGREKVEEFEESYRDEPNVTLRISAARLLELLRVARGRA